MTVPTWIVVLIIMVPWVVAWFMILEWLTERYVTPWIYRKILGRMERRVRRQLGDTPEADAAIARITESAYEMHRKSFT